MLTIYKYQLDKIDGGKMIIKMPEYANIIHLGVQNGIICLWAEVDTDDKIEDRMFRIFGTGHEIEGDGLDYIGTVHMNHKASALETIHFVWHVYELGTY